MQCLILCSEKCFVFNLLQRAVRVLHCRLQCCLSEKCFYLLQRLVRVLHLCSILCNLCVALHADFSVASGAVEWKVEGESVLLHHWTLHHTAPCSTLNTAHCTTLNTEHWTSCSGCSGCRLTVHCTSCSQHTCLLSVGWRFCFNIAWWWMDIIASMVDQLSVKTKSITVLQIKVYKTNIEYTNLKFHLFLVANLKFHLF